MLGFPEQTVYDRVDTVAERGWIALGDLPRPGQSTRLTDVQWTELTATLAASPLEAGYDTPTWTPALVRDYIAETFDVEYSLAHMYRVTTKQILPNNGAGVGSSKKWPTLKAAGYRIVVIDQNTQVIKTEQKRRWFPVNSRPRLPVSGWRASINLLGAVTDNGDRFISFVKGAFTGKVAAHFLRALQRVFGEKLVIVLDNAPYFIAKSLKKQAAKAGLLLEYLPSYAPEMNPLKQCWRQLNEGRANRLYRTLPELKAYLTSRLPTLNSPRLYEYLC